MIDIFEKIMISKELSKSRKYGVKVAIPTRSFILNEGSNLDFGIEIILPSELKNFYESLNSMIISWSLSERNQETIDIFKKDSWLREKYLDNNYDWGVVHEYLSGFINITKVENLFNPNFCKDQAYYHTLSNKQENQDDFFPFDICWSLTACLKREGDEILDNIWLVHTDAEAVYDMGVTIQEYLNLAYQAKGFHYWQLIYVFKEKTEYYELMKRYLPKMLPHITLDLKAFGIE